MTNTSDSNKNTSFTHEHLNKYFKENNLNRDTLKEFTVPDGVIKIGEYVFYSCTSISSIQLPNGLTRIDMRAFAYCTSLTSIKLPRSLTKIDGRAFFGCTSITSIALPNGLIKLGTSAFWGCTALTAIDLPNSLTEIGYMAFDNCASLQYIVTNLIFDWQNIGIDTSRTNILTYAQYLEHEHASLIEETGINNLEPHEAYLINKMIKDQGYLPTWDTLKDTFSNRSITQLHDLLTQLGKSIEAISGAIPSIEISMKDISNIYHSIFIEKINDIIPIIGIAINDISDIYHSIFRYMSINDCENLTDATKQINRFTQHEIELQDNSFKLESAQNSKEPNNLTVKTPDSRVTHNI